MDSKKAERIAAAKKKLKQFQQKAAAKNPSVTQQRENSNQENQATDNGEDCLPTLESALLDDSEVKDTTTDNIEDILQAYENLKKEKEDILLSLKSSQDNVRSLTDQLEEERRVSDDARERLTLLEKAYSGRDSKEEELKHTVSIIVQEKNELSIALKESQEQLKKRESDLAATTKSLKESRLVLKEYTTSRKTEASELNTKADSLSLELDKTKEQLIATQSKLSDLNDEFGVLSNRNSKTEKELIEKESQIKELTLQLELANLNLQQLRNAGPPTVDQSLELMQKENRQLQEQIQVIREQHSKLSVEKDVLAQQYEQYISRLNGQIRSLSSQVETIAAEKRNVESFLEIKDETIRSLESNVNKLKKELENHLATANGHGQMETQIEEKQQQSLRNDKNVEELCTKVHQLNLDNDQLAKLVLEKESHIQELNIKVDRLQNELCLAVANQDSSEREKLLQAMQSDKTAATRAISQNRQLKVQLEELEKAFIQLSNDKLALTEQSQTALCQNKELRERLAILEPELLNVRAQVNELSTQRDATLYWKQELEEAHERIQALSHQNFELKKRVVWNLSQTPVRNGRKHKHEEEHSDELCSHSDSENDEDWVSSEKYQKLLFHYGELEKQHKKSLATIASLNEEKTRLDHLVIQLQSETETIGEYVSLYQVQRGVLRQRADQLAKERQLLNERIENLKLLMLVVAPKLKDDPKWLQLNQNNDTLAMETSNLADLNDPDTATSNIVRILLDITSSNSGEMHQDSSSIPVDSIQLERGECLPHENFHPCQVCSGRLMTV